MPRLAARTFPRISGNPRGGNGAGGGGGMSRVARNDESVPPRFDARAPGAIAIGIRASTGTDLRAKHLREKAMTGISPPPPTLPPPRPSAAAATLHLSSESISFMRRENERESSPSPHPLLPPSPAARRAIPGRLVAAARRDLFFFLAAFSPSSPGHPVDCPG